MTDLAVIPGGPLAALQHARTVLEHASSLTDVKALRDQSEALRSYCQAAGLGLAMQNECAELKLRAERKAGEMLAGNPEVGPGKGDTLSHLGIQRHQSSRWQRVASLPEAEFDAYIAETVTADRELTTAGALQRARAIAAQNPVARPRLHIISTDGGLPGLDGVFSTIVADPPWQYGNTSTRNAANKHYPTMTIDELLALDVEAHAGDDAHLYLWTTAPFLREAFDVMAAWGFTYKTNAVWCKPNLGMGNYFRVSHEHVLFGTRGSLPIAPANRSKSWFKAGQGKHSKKPDSFTDIVEKASPSPGLEMFARTVGRTQQMDNGFDWTYWGNES